MLSFRSQKGVIKVVSQLVCSRMPSNLELESRSQNLLGFRNDHKAFYVGFSAPSKTSAR